MTNRGSDRVLIPALGLFLFVVYFAGDPLVEIGRVLFGVEAPLGIMAYSGGFVLCVLVFVRHRLIAEGRLWVALTLFFALYVNVLTLVGGPRAVGDTYIMVKYLALFGIAFYTVKYLDTTGVDTTYAGIAYPLIVVGLLQVFGLSRGTLGADVNYLRLSGGVAFTGLLTLSVTRGYLRSVLVLVLYTVCLWFMLSRASFFLFLVTGLAVMLFQYGARYNLLAVPLVLGAGYLVSSGLYDAAENIHDYRIIRLLYQPEADTSLQMRLQSLRRGFEVIANNLLFGRYGWQIEEFGDFGRYIHSSLSYWAQFGIVAFGLVVALVLYPARLLLRTYGAMRLQARTFAVAATVFVVLNVMFAKSYRYEALLIPFGAAAYSAFAADGWRSAGALIRVRQPERD